MCDLCSLFFFCFVFIVLPHRFSLSLIHLFFIWPFCSSKSPFVRGFRPKQFALIDSLPRSRLKDRNQYRFLQVSCPPYSRVSQWVSLTRWELRVTGVASCERQRQVSCLRGPAKWKCVKIKIKKKKGYRQFSPFTAPAELPSHSAGSVTLTWNLSMLHFFRAKLKRTNSWTHCSLEILTMQNSLELQWSLCLQQTSSNGYL